MASEPLNLEDFRLNPKDYPNPVKPPGKPLNLEDFRLKPEHYPVKPQGLILTVVEDDGSPEDPVDDFYLDQEEQEIRDELDREDAGE